MTEIIDNILFLFQRFRWTDLLDIVLVTVIFYSVLILLRDTEALVLLRGVLFIIVVLSLFISLVDLDVYKRQLLRCLPLQAI